MEIKEIIKDIIVPLISGFLGGSIGSIVVNKNIKKMKNKNIKVTNGDIFNGDKHE